MAEDIKPFDEMILTRVMRLNAKVQGLVTGLMIGTGVFIATNWLILKGGHLGLDGEILVGPHLSLLGQFFIGYRVTFVGSLIGFTYAFVCGFLCGYSVARLYNWIVDVKVGKRQLGA